MHPMLTIPQDTTIRDTLLEKEREFTGELEVRNVNGKSTISNIYNRYPLKFLTPKVSSTIPWVYMINFGGGLVPGDLVATKFKCGQQATIVVTCQSSTKVYKSLPEKITTQSFDITVEEGGLFVMIPQPVTCFATARYQQRQTLNVETGGSVVCVDWLTCGRCARGECWAFAEYTSKVHLKIGGRLVLNDCTRLSNEDGHDVAAEMRGYHTAANIFIVGPRVKHISALVMARIQSKPVCDLKANKSLICSSTPFLEGEGVLFRLATISTSVAFNFLRDIFKELFEELGNDPYKI